MLCQNCGKSDATRYYRTVVGGHAYERRLCAECAVSTGVDAEFHQSFPGHIPDMPSLLSEIIGLRPKEYAPAGSCPSCGGTLADISRSGKAGCAFCYNIFASTFMPYIQKVHGNAVHAGRSPARTEKASARRKAIGDLEERLQEAVKTQEFEKAAVLRDRIRALQGEV